MLAEIYTNFGDAELENAVSYCYRKINEIFKNIKFVAIYLDDLLIHADTKEKHDEILLAVLLRIRKNKMNGKSRGAQGARVPPEDSSDRGKVG